MKTPQEYILESINEAKAVAHTHLKSLKKLLKTILTKKAN